MSQESMEQTISTQNVDQTHRLSDKKVKAKSQPIVVDFTCYNIRKVIHKNKKKIKGERIGVTENFIAKGLKILHVARGKH